MAATSAMPLAATVKPVKSVTSSMDSTTPVPPLQLVSAQHLIVMFTQLTFGIPAMIPIIDVLSVSKMSTANNVTLLLITVLLVMMDITWSQENVNRPNKV